ncbi:septal ring lytic transglycosylase RlpA family protein [Parvularcula sp. IMCC14364]|uniref:septal ring lytic transglycosylase RlpA family protein n=1 Tax=Parvularcula sp. IMCC14364 TaxID=3067902 RepID=UPI00274288A8|nr:septal ring lytic transglycosylase RlpA family protein [Parvularcula sp. IMCC14364]
MAVSNSLRHSCLVALGLVLVSACASNTDLPPAPSSITGGTSQPAGKNPYGEASPHRKVGNPYKVAGIWYYPEVDEDYDAQGVASWYGPKFHGRKTANGEIFDMNRLTAAHPTLPLPSIVRVTNLENGKSINLRLNDRGPFAHGRVIDLSRAAAEEIGYRHDGLARVRVEYLGEASLDDAILALGEPEAFQNGRLARVTHAASNQANPQYDTVRTRIATGPEITVTKPLASESDLDAALIRDAKVAVARAEEMVVETAIPAENLANVSTIAPPKVTRRPVGVDRASDSLSEPDSPVAGRYTVQVAAFSARSNADKVIALFEDSQPVRSLRTEKRGGGWLYKVRLGPFTSREEAESALERAKSEGFADARIVRL